MEQMDDLAKKFQGMKPMERELQRLTQGRARAERTIKDELLPGATIELGNRYAELRLLPGRDPASKNPDGYDLCILRFLTSAARWLAKRDHPFFGNRPAARTENIIAVDRLATEPTTSRSVSCGPVVG